MNFFISIRAVLFLSVLECFVAIASSQNNVRLVGGINPKEGRVEIFHDGEWGTICTNSWDDQDAKVACLELGLGTNGEDVDLDVFGEGVGKIWLDNVRCTGSEGRLNECVSDGWGNHGCGHDQDVAVRCLDFIRLAGNENPTNGGRVEVFHDGQWGTVCDDYWSKLDATVVCRELGLGSSGLPVHGAQFGEGDGPVWLDDVGCAGEEDNLYLCVHSHWGVSDCNHDQDAGVICGDFVKLVNGSDSSEGRVEVFQNGEWGTVCDDNWSDADAAVVCRQLGLGDYGEAIGNAALGEGNGTIWLGDVYCTGSERSLYTCGSSPWNAIDCHHDEDAGVKCYRHVPSPSSVAASTASSPTDNIPSPSSVAASTASSPTDNTVFTNHPVLYVVISLLAVAVAVLAVYIVNLRRRMKQHDMNQSEVYNAAYQSSDANYAGGAAAKYDGGGDVHN